MLAHLKSESWNCQKFQAVSERRHHSEFRTVGGIKKKTEVTWVQTRWCKNGFRWRRDCNSSSCCHRGNDVRHIARRTGWEKKDNHLQNQPESRNIWLFSRSTWSICQLPLLSRQAHQKTSNLLPQDPHNCQTFVPCISEKELGAYEKNWAVFFGRDAFQNR